MYDQVYFCVDCSSVHVTAQLVSVTVSRCNKSMLELTNLIAGEEVAKASQSENATSSTN